MTRSSAPPSREGRPRKEAAPEPQETDAMDTTSTPLEPIPRGKPGECRAWCWWSKMSEDLIRESLAGQSLGVYVRSVYLALCRISSNYGNRARLKVGQREIAKLAMCSIRQVGTCLARLEQMGLLRIEIDEKVRSFSTYHLLKLGSDVPDNEGLHNMPNGTHVVQEGTQAVQTAKHVVPNGTHGVPAVEEDFGNKGEALNKTEEKPQQQPPASRDGSGGRGESSLAEKTSDRVGSSQDQDIVISQENQGDSPTPQVPLSPPPRDDIPQAVFLKAFATVWKETSDDGIPLSAGEMKQVKSLLHKHREDWQTLGLEGLIWRFSFARWAWKSYGQKAIEVDGLFDDLIFPCKHSTNLGQFFRNLVPVRRWYAANKKGSLLGGFDKKATEGIIRDTAKAMDEAGRIRKAPKVK